MGKGEAQGCPWGTLGVERKASAEEVRQAYRKMAFKWHPDTNRGTADAVRRFQAATDAFEEIKLIQAADESRRAQFRSQYGTASAPRQNMNHNYRRGTGSTFYEFRERGSSPTGFRSGYADEESIRRRRRGVRYENLHMIRSRIRMFESLGMSLGIFVAAAAVGLAFVGSEVMWQSVNRGKSFEEVVEEMQGRPDRKAVAGRRMRRGGEVAEDVDDVSS